MAKEPEEGGVKSDAAESENGREEGARSEEAET